jgi:nucleoside phosphorylase
VTRGAGTQHQQLPGSASGERWEGGGVAWSGVGRRATVAALEGLAAAGAERVLHLGCAGGLLPGLVAGDAFWISAAHWEDSRLACAGDPGLRERLTLRDTALRETECVTVREVTGPAGKLALSERYPAAGVVEMETYWAVEAAQRLGISLSCVRVVIDGRDDELPDLSDALDSLGRVKPLAFAWKLVRSPKTLRKLPHVARAFGVTQAKLGALGDAALGAEGGH